MMKKCKNYSKWIWLNFYDELKEDQARELQEHLNTCANCLLEFQDAEKTFNLLNQKIDMQPTEKELQDNRSELHERLMLAKRARLRKEGLKKLWLRMRDIVSLEFAPRYRFATAVALLILGILMGRYFSNIGITASPNGKTLTDKNVAAVDYLKYNPSTGKVSVQLKVLDEALIEGNVDDPHIQTLLVQSLMTSEMPNIRLRSVDALATADRLMQPAQTALISALERDENPGIRLKAAKILNSLPVNEQVRDLLINTMIKVLESEPNSAVRNEAIDGLSRMGEEGLRALIFEAAHLDSNEYLQYKTSKINRTKLERLK
ncbi:hypothetical protein GF337_06485 [candidate division KSB1 bacterium]|nr:hypothetical protein [candidate division KSB1 bacterium]